MGNSSSSPTAHQSNGTAYAAVPASPDGDAPLRQRWSIVLLLAAAFVINNMDKVNMSVGIIPMSQEMGWSATDRGIVSSAFFWGYCLTQVPAGWIATRIGGAKVLLAGVFMWSFATALAPPAAEHSLQMLCFSRVLVGLGEGFAPAAATHIMATIVPKNERSRAATTVYCGLDVGSALGVLVVGPLIAHYGWPSGFYSFAFLGFVWCAVWPYVHPELRQLIANRKQQDPDPLALPTTATSEAIAQGKPESVPWRQFFTSVPVWAMFVTHFCSNYGYFTLLAWLPSYFQLALGLDVEASSLATLIPCLAVIPMNPIAGTVADRLVESGMDLTSVRKLCQNIAFLVPAGCMLTLAALSPPPYAAPSAALAPVPVLVATLACAFAFSAWSHAGLFCNHQDMSPRYAGALLGIGNTFGAIPGILGVVSAGWLFDHTGSWALAIFLPAAACQIVGAVVYTAFGSSERQPWS